MTGKSDFMGKGGVVSFLVDGEFKSRLQTTAMAFGRTPRRQAAWTYTTASPTFQSVWRHRCGRCRPL